jgi:chromosome segregation ATPase
MQANAKITEEVIEEQTQKVESLAKLNAELQQQIQSLKESNNVAESNVIQDLKKQVEVALADKQTAVNQLSELRTQYRDYDSVKNQAGHVDTFKAELIKAREELSKTRAEMDKRIDALTAENNGKISGLTEQHERNVALLIQKQEAEKVQLSQKIDELTVKIEYLQLPPAKRKKIDELNKEGTQTTLTKLVESEPDSVIKDGGSF